MAFLFKAGRLIQVKITKKDKHGTATGWPRPLNRDGRLIQVPNTTFVCAKNRDFKNWPLNRGWPLNTGPLYTGSTVFSFVLEFDRTTRILFVCFVLFCWRVACSLQSLKIS